MVKLIRNYCGHEESCGGIIEMTTNMRNIIHLSQSTAAMITTGFNGEHCQHSDVASGSTCGT
jgi:hypothetical protein